MKPVIWLGDSLARVRGFEPEARREAGYQLGGVQAGKEPAHWKPMAAVGLGANELRVQASRAYRVIYLAKFPEAIYVLHAFEKTSRKTSSPDIELARNRFRALVRERRQQ